MNRKNVLFLKIDSISSAQMKKDIQKLIAYCQSKGADVIGFGEEYRSVVYHSNLTREKWHEMFPRAKVNVKVDFTIVKTRLVE